MASPPGTPPGLPARPLSAVMRAAPRTGSRLSMSAKTNGGGSRSSDEDGKTSVKVAVRVRPPLQPSDPGFDLIPQRFQRSMVQVTSSTSLAVDSPQGRKLFVFDRVFGEAVSQEGIWEYLAESVTAFVQGYNISMLAYGQSGAGKSYTMGTSGPLEQSDAQIMGVIPRAAHALFEKLEGPKPTSSRNSVSALRPPSRYSGTPVPTAIRPNDKNWVLKATYVEIYNEHLRDLLVPEHVPAHERPAVTIREDTKGHILLTGLHQVEIHSVEELMAALNFGSTIRQTDSTAINAKSSRSHAVFSLNLVQRKSKLQTAQGAEKRFSVPLEAMTGAETMLTIDSKLHFVDLAGSERLKNTGAQGERAKEGISINAGLASLGKVISQLSSRQAGSHVSYRDSKLTRLLQDSLGGNAITYMIACVTPPEFHLSETLNTVQYAQRARAIQSKPKIQQVSEESDKQAVIDRLKAEVAFLREQIRSTDRAGPDRRPTTERPERKNEREMELQNQLLDQQENYTALSQRHANLIAELAKARDDEHAENQAGAEPHEDSATERLNRSNSFAAAVDKVVMEYERTIQSLEQSLSSTRSTLGATEASLLEKEAKCAYAETHGQQLQARLNKLMDREASTEHYLHDLEAKLDVHTSGEEKNSTIVMELRKEIARVRENEAACEDYISTLEERLAEADQDAEAMQREVERLEHVVERQRSLGKLDHLLYELDSIQKEDKKTPSERGNGAGIHSRNQSLASKRSVKDSIPETVHESDGQAEDEEVDPATNGTQEEDRAGSPATQPGEDVPHIAQSPAQSKYMEEKFENVTQELFDLRVEHESTVNEFNSLSSRYEDNLRELSELRDALDEARHKSNVRDSIMSTDSAATTRPLSFLADARVNGSRQRGQSSSSRSLSSELSSAGESTSRPEQSDAAVAEKVVDAADTRPELPIDATVVVEVEGLREAAAEQQRRYEELEQQHLDALDMVEELKSAVSKAKMDQESTTSRAATPVIRRKSSQNVMIIDRAHRSFASLRNIASENLDHNPDVMQAFEVNLNAAMHELHARSERIQELEADIASVKKEMDAKTTMITGLTRERSSMKSSPMDISVVAVMRDQLLQNENQMRLLQERHSSREQALAAEVADLKRTLQSHKSSNHEKTVSEDIKDLQDKKIASLQAELVSWEERHQSALASLEQSEKHLLKTIANLEEQMTQHHSTEQSTRELVADLQQQVEEHKQASSTHAKRVAELEGLHAAAVQDLKTTTSSHDSILADVEHHRALVRELEQQVLDHERVVKTHKDGLELMQANHAQMVDDLQIAHRSDRESHIKHLTEQHREQVESLEKRVDDLQSEMTRMTASLGVVEDTAEGDALSKHIDGLVADRAALLEERKMREELETHVLDLASINEKIMNDLSTVKTDLNEILKDTGDAAMLKDGKATLAEQMIVLRQEMGKLTANNEKNSRLVAELEDQLASNFDQHQIATNRLSTLQSERDSRYEEVTAAHMRAQGELEAIKEDFASLQVSRDRAEASQQQRLMGLQAKYEDMQPGASSSPKRTNSTNLRKSTSAASLPSPPPAIPLPPLPGSISAAMSSVNGTTTPVTGASAPSTANRPSSRDLSLTQIQQDQEARIKTIENHLRCERQLNVSLEEALSSLEEQCTKGKADSEAWRRRAGELERELELAIAREKTSGADKENRWSLVQLEQEQKKRREAELARAHLEERMNALSQKKKKKGSLNCF